MEYTYKPDYFQSLYKLHKDGQVDSDFGLDNSKELFQDSFGLYSSAGLKEHIGPHKAQYYRIGIGLKGSIKIDSTIRTMTHFGPFISFTIPGQVFSIFDKSDDFFSYYLLFSEKFIQDAISLKNIFEIFPFLCNPSLQVFTLSDYEASRIVSIIQVIDEELKNNHSNAREVIQLQIHQILIAAKRSLERQALITKGISPHLELMIQFRKLISIHFLEHLPLAFYAEKLYVSIPYLNKVIKETTGKSAHGLIDEMILIEAKILLRYTKLSVNEIAYQLSYNDASYFVRLFKKLSGQTPLNYRQML